MPDNVEFAVGDRVRFKPEHYDYRDQQRAPNEFVVVRVVAKCAYWSAYRGAFFDRVERVHLEGPW